MQNTEFCAIFRLLLMISPPTLNVIISSLRVDCLKIGTTFWSSARSLSFSLTHSVVPSIPPWWSSTIYTILLSWLKMNTSWLKSVQHQYVNLRIRSQMRKWYEFSFLDLLFSVLICSRIDCWSYLLTYTQMVKLLNILKHASQCHASKAEPCSHPNCSQIKKLFSHASKCEIRVNGGCQHCKKIWFILTAHSRNCKDSECRIPRCRCVAIKILHCLENLDILFSESFFN